MAISDSRRSIDVPNLSFAPSEDSRRPAPGAVTNALNGPARPPSGVTTTSPTAIDDPVPQLLALGPQLLPPQIRNPAHNPNTNHHQVFCT